LSMNINTTGKTGRVMIILNSGTYDRVNCALSIALAALASEMEVHLMLTYEGLKRFTKDHISQVGDDIPTSLKSDLEWGLENGPVQPLEQQLADAKSMGLKVYACPNAMACMRIPKNQLVGVDEVMGLVAFLELSRTAAMHWYI
jgi:peroxiredoxin family protein